MTVLVVGGGPTGLAAALFLARAGVPVRLVERRPHTSTLPRATHLSRRTMELLREAGLQEAVAAEGFEVVAGDDPRGFTEPDRVLPRTVVGVRSLSDLDAAEVLETGEEELAVPGPCPPFWCGQHRTEPLLREAAVRAGADVRFGEELTGLSVSDDGVIARVRRADGRPTTVTARYLIAADGAHGWIPETVGIARAGLGTIARRTSILFRADLTPLVEGRRFFMSMIENPGFSGAVMQLDAAHWWAAAVESDAVGGPGGEPDPVRCLELVRAALGTGDIPVELTATFHWQARHRIAERYRAGPVFLAGDAAHLHPPAGGYGSNAGIQDAHNLAWKIAAVLRGWAGAELLDSYDAERRPVGIATAEQALLLDGVPGERIGAEARDPRTVIMGYRYRSTAVIGGAGRGGPLPHAFELSGEPGTRLPHLPLSPGRDGGPGQGSVLDLCAPDAFGPRFLLLGGDESWSRTAAEVARELAVPVTARVLRPPDPLDQVCGTGPGGALLVRPDGFVAWRCTAAEPPAGARRHHLLTTALRRVLRPVAVRTDTHPLTSWSGR
ncbi:FAD-dependent monooxygenase [Streptomyces sp. NPDC058326]|uniref:FAD-dependent monooxygenase n=1 Tax=Streptomyces sp. NPDC058326 TaxID=3346447 RepID=UPI0036E30076